MSNSRYYGYNSNDEKPKKVKAESLGSGLLGKAAKALKGRKKSLDEKIKKAGG
jgi:hypothetical protein